MSFLEQRPILPVLLMIDNEIDEIAEAVGLTRPSTLKNYGYGGRGSGQTTLAMLWATLLAKKGHQIFIVATTLDLAENMRRTVEEWCERLGFTPQRIDIASLRSRNTPLAGDKVVIDPDAQGWLR